MFIRQPRSPAISSVGAAGGDLGALARDDRVGELAVFDRRRSRRSRSRHRHSSSSTRRQALDAGEQPARLLAHTEFAQAGAGIVVGCDALVARRDLRHAEPVDQKAHELEALGGEGDGLDRHIRLVGEQLGIVLGQHAGAGAAGRDDIIAVGEGFDGLSRDRPGGRAVAGIVGRLAAATLRRRDDFAAGVLKQLHSGEPDARDGSDRPDR